MIKRIFDILTFPIYFIYTLMSFPVKIVKIIVDNWIEKGKDRNRKIFIKTSDQELIQVGQLLYSELSNDYLNFMKSYLKDKKSFLIENKKLLKGYSNFELDKLHPIEAIYIFGNIKEQLWVTDWRGEENEKEIENFIEDKLKIKSEWTSTNELRTGAIETKKSDGEFIIDILKTIDKDLETLNKRLIFFNLNWDAYVYTVVDQSSHKIIIDKFGTLFHGIEKVKI